MRCAQLGRRRGLLATLGVTLALAGVFLVVKYFEYSHKLHPALDGKLANVRYVKDPVFGFEVPMSCEGVPEAILDPANTWPSRAEYFKKYDALAARFIENFKLFKAECPTHIVEAGPKRVHETEGAAV